MKSAFLTPLVFCLFIHFTNAQCLPTWNYYTPVEVTNNVSSSLTNFQVKIIINTSSLISSGKMNSSGNDIRFVDSTCKTMSYWIESGINTSNTVIWVKIPSLSGSAKKTIRMYYGNSTVSAGSNGDSTFLVFDDFDGSSLNTTKWTLKKTNSASLSVSSGKLNMSCIYSSSVPESVNIRSANSYSSPIISEGFVSTVSGYYPFIGILNSGSDYGYAMFYDSKYINPPGMYMGQCYPHSGGNIAGTKSYTSANPTNVTGLWQYYWPSSNSEKGVWPGGSINGSTTGLSLSSSVNPVIGLIFVSDATMAIDWFRARKYAPTEPGSTLGTEVANSYTIKPSYTSGNAFCQGSELKIMFSANGIFNANNIFTAQLSDSLGSFSNPIKIGSISSSKADTIAAQIPSGLFGSKFRIRILSSSPAFTGEVSADDIAIVSRTVPGFNVNKFKQCLTGNSFSFTNTTSGTGPISYSWHFGDGETSADKNPQHIYTKPGDYTVVLYATNSVGCTDSVLQGVSVYHSTPYFSIDDTLQCLGDNSFTFKNETTGHGNLSYRWEFGDGGFSTAVNAVYNYAVPGTYTVKLYSTSFLGCTDSTARKVTVTDDPQAAFKMNSNTQCFNGNNFVFQNLSVIASGNLIYSWSFGDGTFSADKNPSHQYLDTGSYFVRLGVKSEAGCTDFDSVLVKVFPSPSVTVNADGNDTFCKGESIFFYTNISPGYTYQWLKDGNPISSANKPSYKATETGSYRLIVINGNGCSDTSEITFVKVNPVPDKPVIVQTGETLKVTDSAAMYEWFLDGALIISATSSAYSPTIDSGVFTVRITDENGCSNTSDPNYYINSGIGENKSKHFIHIFPNPATEKLNIQLANDISYGDLEMYDFYGRLAKSVDLRTVNRLFYIDVRNLPAGMYFLKLNGRNDVSVEKVLLQ
jgi:PKD repeat protein